jgi:outer membrane immunogenic protein
MKTLPSRLLGLAMAGTIAHAAAAADWGPSSYKDGPYIPVSAWTGFYLGVNAGGAWAQASDQLAFPPDAGGGVQPSGGTIGLQLGYNWQGALGYCCLVLGFEADIQIAGVDGEGSDRIGAGDVFRSRLEDFGTVRGRIGYAMDRSLLYFTGGFAYGSVKHEASIPAIPADFLVNKTTGGYTLGGGLEYKITPTVSLKGEYQYINLGTNDPADPGAGRFTANGGTIRDDAFHTVRAGLNWFPFPAYAPLK